MTALGTFCLVLIGTGAMAGGWWGAFLALITIACFVYLFGAD